MVATQKNTAPYKDALKQFRAYALCTGNRLNFLSGLQGQPTHEKSQNRET